MKNKTLTLAAMIVVITMFFAACGKTENKTETTDKSKDEKKENVQPNDNKTSDVKSTDVKTTAGQETAEVKLPTVQCSTCKKNITKALKKVDGVGDFKIDIDGKKATINYDKSKADLTKIEKAITGAGYDANDKKSDPDAYSNLDDCCKLPKDRK